MKKLISHSGFILLASLIAILLLMPPTQAHAADITASGTFGAEGDNLTWTLDTEGTLTISGTGEMADDSSAWSVPWYSQRSSIKQIIIKSGVTNIGSSAFSGCVNLASITIPGSVTSIGFSAFFGCSSLTGIWVDENNAAYSSDTQGVIFNKDKSALCMAPGAIGPEYVIPESVISIDHYAFYGCSSLISVTIPGSVTDLGWNTFASCSNLTSVDIQANISYIGHSVFFGCVNLTSIVIPDSVTFIDSWAFANCRSLTSVTIPASVTYIGFCSFSGCDGLTSVIISKSVTDISDGAFVGCSDLEKVLYKGAPEEWAQININPNNAPLLNATIYYGYFPGDADDDGEITDWDAIVLNRYLAGWIVEINLSALDIDGDGEVTDWDGIVLERYLAGWDISING